MSTTQLAASFSMLTPAQIANLAATNNLTEAQLKEALRTSSLILEKKQEVWSHLKSATAKGTDAAATNTLTFSMGNLTTALWANIKALGVWLVTNPVGRIMLVVGAIAAAVAIFKTLNTTVDEHIEKIQELDQEYDSNQSSIESLESELESTAERMRELEGIESPTLVEQAELARLRETNSELEREITLLKQRNAEVMESREREAEQAWIKMNTPSLDNFVIRQVFDENGQWQASVQEYLSDVEYADYLMKEIKDNEKALFELEADGIKDNERRTQKVLEDRIRDYKASLGEIRDAAYEIGNDEADALADKIMGFFDPGYMYTKLQNLSDSFLGKNAGIASLVKADRDGLEGLDAAIERAVDSLRNQDGFDAWISAGKRFGYITDDSTASVWSLVKASFEADRALSDAASGVDDFKTSLKSLSSLQSDIESLSKALGTFKEDGILSAQSLSDLSETFGSLDEFREFASVLGNSSSSMEQVREACNSLASAYVKSSSYLNGLTEDTKELYIEQLESIGVTNAQEVVIATLTEAIWNSSEAIDSAAKTEIRKAAHDAEAILAAKDLGDAEWDKAEKFLRSAGATQTTISSLQLYRQEIYNANIDTASFARTMTSDGISSLMSMANAAGVAAEKIGYLAAAFRLQKTLESGNWNSIQVDIFEKSIRDLVQKAKASASDAASTIELPTVEVKMPAKSSSGSSSKKEVEEYTADIDQFRIALDKLEDTKERIDLSEAKLDLIPEDDIEAKTKAIYDIISLYRTAQDDLHALNNERDAYLADTKKKLEAQGFQVEFDPDTNEFFVTNMEHLNDLKAYVNGAFDQEATNEMRKFYEELIKNAESVNAANVEGSREWFENEKKILDLRKQIRDDRLDALNKEKDALEELLDLTIDMIKQEQEDEIDALEDQKDRYDEIISRRKELLSLMERERSYDEEKSEKLKDLSKLQARADALKLAADTGDRDAALEYGSVMEDIAELQKELNDVQHEHFISSTEDALDKELDVFEKRQDEKIDEIQAFLKDNERMQKAALDRLNTANSNFFDQLKSYALKYTSTTGSELEDMWSRAMAAAQRYGDYTSAMSSMSDSNIDKEATASGIVSQMKNNASQWHSASAEDKKKLQDDNVLLAKELSSLLGASVTRNGDGEWIINGKKLFEVYHTGTPSAGGIPTLKQNEIFAKLENTEMVLNQGHQNALWNILSNFDPSKLVEKFLSPLSVLNNLRAVPTDGPAYKNEIDASIHINGSVPDKQIIEAIKKQQRKIVEIIGGQIV